MSLSEHEIKEWLQHPVTVELKRILQKKRDEMKNDWEGGSFTDYDPAAMALTSVGNIGTCRGYAWVQEFDYEQYITEIEDE